jgi:hypothetical protein
MTNEYIIFNYVIIPLLKRAVIMNINRLKETENEKQARKVFSSSGKKI